MQYIGHGKQNPLFANDSPGTQACTSHANFSSLTAAIPPTLPCQVTPLSADMKLVPKK